MPGLYWDRKIDKRQTDTALQNRCDDACKTGQQPDQAFPTLVNFGGFVSLNATSI